MTEENPTEFKPYVSMDCTYQQGMLVLEILGYRISNHERGHIQKSFPSALEKHEGNLLKTMCDLFAYNILTMRRLNNPRGDPRLKKTGEYDVAVIRYWQRMKEAELIEKIEAGLSLSTIHYEMFTMNPVIEEAKRIKDKGKDPLTAEEDIWGVSRAKDKGKDIPSIEDRFDEGW
ncbi:MAG: hypothetical protein KAT43_02295 [Nanoarchaeota archaeon]|nr:hypothetical protein [Nanoarchaeota archaeon]